MRYDHYGYPIFPGERGYMICGLDVDRFESWEENFAEWLARQDENRIRRSENATTNEGDQRSTAS